MELPSALGEVMPEVAELCERPQLCRMILAAAPTVDLNADAGEAFGRYSLDDAALFDVVTSASIACGMHAGDPVVMRETILHAKEHGVSIGAHPGYPDLQGFGRREMAMSPSEIEAFVTYQIGALAGMCVATGARLTYVKAHGALYNRAARDVAAAEAIVRAVRSVDDSLALLALAGSAMIAAAEQIGVRAVSEAFADRAYRVDGSLVPRSESGSVLTDPDEIASRVVRMVCDGVVLASDGTSVSMHTNSICAHGDGASALAVVRAVRGALEAAGVRVVAFAAM